MFETEYSSFVKQDCLKMSSYLNHTYSPGSLTTSRPTNECHVGGDIAHIVFCSLVILFGVPGNCVILRVYWAKPRKTTTHVLIMGLAWTDFATCLLLVHAILSNCIFGISESFTPIVILRYLLLSSVTVSVQLICLIAIDRYDSVCRPLNRILNYRRILVAILLSIVYSVATTGLYFAVQVENENNLLIPVVMLSVQLIGYAIAAVNNVLCYTAVCWTIRNHVKVRNVSMTESRPQRSRNESVPIEMTPVTALSCDDGSKLPGLPRNANANGQVHYPPDFTHKDSEPGPSTRDCQAVDNEATLKNTVNKLCAPRDSDPKAPSTAKCNKHCSAVAVPRASTVILQRKTTRMLLVTNVVFLLAWVPYWIYVGSLLATIRGAEIPDKIAYLLEKKPNAPHLVIGCFSNLPHHVSGWGVIVLSMMYVYRIAFYLKSRLNTNPCKHWKSRYREKAELSPFYCGRIERSPSSSYCWSACTKQYRFRDVLESDVRFSSLRSGEKMPSNLSISDSGCVDCWEDATQISPCNIGGDVFHIVFCLLVMLFGIPGNALILSVYYSKPRKTTTHIMIISLAWSDLFSCVFLVHPIISSCVFGIGATPVPIAVLRCFLFSAVGVSVSLTSLIAFDRYDCICRRSKRLLSFRRAIVAVLVIVMFHLTITSIQVAVVVFSRPGSHSIGVFTVVLQLTSYLVATVMIVVCYGTVYRTIRNHVKVGIRAPRRETAKQGEKHSIQRQTISNNSKSSATNVSVGPALSRDDVVKAVQPNAKNCVLPGPSISNDVVNLQPGAAMFGLQSRLTQPIETITSQSNSHAEHMAPISDVNITREPPNPKPPESGLQRKTTRMLLVTSIVFLLSWAPHWTNLISYAAILFGGPLPSTEFFFIMAKISYLLFLNDAVNPLIYGLANRHFRKDCKETLHKLRPC
ncbi:uncharacterized protein LOC110982080 [Acanthaster planci]|uniref:Uncharacterized protein LOC110982080 n=1 Tax=Acanthaster planci TaxID=133434 RepID=A0A8B7YTW9_ACAPL|nr:uncharacterized protein LOC110982080 [Acanthaster planci]